jgi:diacylglycerol kinase family enzyme
MLRRGRDTTIDLGRVDFTEDGKPAWRYFIQLAGVGLDARAVELVSWKLKTHAGPLAYVVAGFQALSEKQPRITVQAGGKEYTGELILFGNGRFYGGSFAVFPGAKLDDGFLDARIIPHVSTLSMTRLGCALLCRQKLSDQRLPALREKEMHLTSDSPAAFELDGEWAGYLPATFSVEPKKLRVVVP